MAGWLMPIFMALVASGCATSFEAPHIVAVTPSILQQGKPTTINVQLSAWREGTQLALMPAGPYVTHRLGMASAPQMLVSDGPRVYVVTSDGQLRIVDFPENAPARELGQVENPGGKIVAMVTARGQLLMALSDGRVRLWDVADATAPSLLWEHRLRENATDGFVRDLQLDEKSAYLLLGNQAGVTAVQQLAWSTDARPALVQQWQLPVAASAFEVRNDHVWLAGPNGVAVVHLLPNTAELVAWHDTSGMPSDVQLRGNLALVVDGRGGLVVFDVSDADRLHWLGSYNKRGAVTAMSATKGGALVALANGTVMAVGLANPLLPRSGAVYKPEADVVAMTAQEGAVVLATQNGLQRVIMADDGDGAISSEGLNLGGSRRGVIRDNILYVADWFSGLHLYDISIPQQPRHIANYHTPGSSKGVALLGNYALVGDDDWGLQIIDIEDPQRPGWVAELPPEALAEVGLAYTMKLMGKTLYLADHRGGFHIIDLHDIHHPRRLGGFDTAGKSWAIDVVESGEQTVAFVADDRSGLLMFDVSDPTQPKPFAQFNPGGQAEDVVIQGDRAYVAFFDKGLYVLDISDPYQAKVLGHTPIPGNARGIELGDGLAYVASWEAGLQIVDTRDPAALGIIGSFDTDGAAWGVNVKDGTAYVLDWWGGIKVVDVRQPSQPAYVGRYHARGAVQQMRTRGNYLYAASGAGGLQVYDIKNPLNPIWVTGLDLDGQSQGLWIKDELIYVAAGDGGVVVLDSHDPFYTRHVGGIDTPGEAHRVRAWGKMLYVADSRAGLMVFDMHDPQRPLEVSRLPVQPHDFWVDEHGLWTVSENGIAGWRYSADGKLQQWLQQDYPGGFAWVRSQGDRLVAVTRTGMVRLWRRVPTGLEPMAQYDARESITDLQLAGDKLYLVGQQSGLMELVVSSSSVLRLAAVYPPTGRYTSVAIARGAAFFAGEPKIASVNLLPAINVDSDASAGLKLVLPAGLPLGNYHLLMIGPGGKKHLRPLALKVQFTDPAQKKFPLDSLRRILKTPLKPPPGSQ